MKTGESSARKKGESTFQRRGRPRDPNRLYMLKGCSKSSLKDRFSVVDLSQSLCLFSQRDTGTRLSENNLGALLLPGLCPGRCPSPAGTESAAYPRGAPRRSRKSRWQSCGSRRSLCSTGRCHGALPTPGHTSCEGNTKQRGAEPPPPSAWMGTEAQRA